MALDKFKASPLPNPPAQYDAQYIRQMIRVLEVYFNQLDSDAANHASKYTADQFNLNTLATGTTVAPGTMSWNPVAETVDIGMANGVTQQVGEEYYARVENNTGVTILNGAVVGFAGPGIDDAISVEPYLADGSSPSSNVIGVMTHDLPDTGDLGYATVWGGVHDLDTSAFAVGDILYASPTVTGGLTNVKPTAPNNVVQMGIVLTSHATQGIIFVRPIIAPMQYYGIFTKTDSQTPAAINTEYLVTFTGTANSNGVVIGSPASRIVVPQSGLYTFLPQFQISSTSSSAKNLWIWYKKNGTAVPNSARIITTNINNGYTPLIMPAFFNLNANDYVEIAFAADSTAVSLSTAAATAFAPAAPAAILSVVQTQQ